MSKQTKLVRIHIQGGVLQEVEGLPAGLDYELLDHDQCEAEQESKCVWCQQREG